MLAFLVPAAVAAATSISVPGDAQMLGWTDDGRYLVWTGSADTSSGAKTYFLPKGDDRVEVKDPDKLPAADRARLQVDESDMEFQADERAQLATVHDVMSGAEQRYVLKYAALSYEGRTKGELKKKLAGLADGAAFEAWKKGRKLVKAAARKGPRGCTLEVSARFTEDDDTGEPPRWKGNRASWGVGSGATLTLSTVCGADRGVDTFQQDMAAMYTPHWSATPVWDPTGRRVLVVLEEAVAQTMRGPDGGRVEYHLVPAGPKVEVVAPEGLAGAVAKVADAVEGAGFPVVATGPAKAARTATVVYADDAHAAAAAKVAAAIPGGASVDKLTWKPKAEIVVALGESAR